MTNGDPPPVASPGIHPLQPGDLHVMTFNVRVDHDSSPHSWPERRRVIQRLLDREQPHLIGTQEGLYHQICDFATALPERYQWIGMGREGGSRDEFLAIFFDATRFEPIEFDHYWLSETPQVVGSKSWDTRSVRMVTWARFVDRDIETELALINTHLDDGSEMARRESAKLVAHTARELGSVSPVIVTGDFNAPVGSPVYETMTQDANLKDTWVASGRRGRSYASYHGYGPLIENGDRIDWILTSPGVTTRAAMQNPIRLGSYPSDHLPYQAVLRLP